MARKYRRNSKGQFAATAGSKISPSPRRLTAAEKAYAEIKAQKSKFRSDAKVQAEMQRRGFLKGADPRGQLINIASSSRRKRGQAF